MLLPRPWTNPDVDLQLVEREHAKGGEGRGSPRVVKGESDAHCVEAAEHLLVDVRAGTRPGRHDLQRHGLRREVVGGEHRRETVGELRVVEEPVRDVDRDTSR